MKRWSKAKRNASETKLRHFWPQWFLASGVRGCRGGLALGRLGTWDGPILNRAEYATGKEVSTG